MNINEMSDNQLVYTMWLWAARIVGGALLVNGIRAAFGFTVFAWWHLGTLAVCILFAWCMKSECDDEAKQGEKRKLGKS